MLLVTANTMGQSIRERINEIGVMKTLGFSAAGVTAMVFGEALLVTAIGGVIGLALATVFAKGLGTGDATVSSGDRHARSAYVIGGILIVVLGALAAALPCMQAWRLKIVDALRTGVTMASMHSLRSPPSPG